MKKQKTPDNNITALCGENIYEDDEDRDEE